MGDQRNRDLDHRLEAYFATLRSCPPRTRSVAAWQIYAAVTGSALAMAAGASAAEAGNAISPGAEPAASVSPKRNFASSRNAFWKSLKAAAAETGKATASQGPSIFPAGVVPLYGTQSIIQPGEWISIYGTNLAAGDSTWNGDFPLMLGGTSVEINGKAAFLEFVSPGQINLQAPDDTATGTVSVVVTTAAGSGTATVTLSPVAPSFSLREAQGASFVSGIILRSNGSGAYGNGTYDILGPTGNSGGESLVAAQPGDMVELFAVGFGPTTPHVPAGQAFSGAAPLNDDLTLYINNVVVKPSFAGISSAGTYQINLRVPSGLGDGNVPIEAFVGGLRTQSGVLFPLAGNPILGGGGGTVGPGTGGPGPGGGTNFGTSFGRGTSGEPGGTGGDPGGGSGGGGSGSAVRRKKKPYTPRLRFPSPQAPQK